MVSPSIQLPLPFRITAEPPLVATRLAYLAKEQCWARVHDLYAHTVLEGKDKDAVVLDEYFITKWDIIQVYFFLHAYHANFDIKHNLKKVNDYQQPCAVMNFWFDNAQLILTNIVPRSSAAKIPRWRHRMRNAWLQKVGDIKVSSVADVKRAILALSTQPRPSYILTFSHPEIKHGLTNDGVPQLNVDQLNSINMFRYFSMPEGALDKPTATIC